MPNTCGWLVANLRTDTRNIVRFFTYSSSTLIQAAHKYGSLSAISTHSIHRLIHTFFIQFTPVTDRVMPSIHSTNKKLQKVLTKNLLLITGKVV